MKTSNIALSGVLLLALGVFSWGFILSTTRAQALESFSPVSFSWSKTWGGDKNESVHNVARDAFGNLYMTGEFAGTVNFDPSGPNPNATFTSQNNTIDVFLSKFDANGNFLWVKTWGGGPASGFWFTGRDVGNGLVTDSAGNVYVSGPFQYTVDFNPDPVVSDVHASNAVNMNNIFFCKFASDGTFQWVRTWGPSNGGAESYNLAIDAADNIYVVGDFAGSSINFNPWDPQHPDWHSAHVNPSGISYHDAFLSKFDSDGNFKWAKTWGGEGYDDGPGVAINALGNIYVAGMYGSTNINFDPDGGVNGLGHPAHDSGHITDVFVSKFAPDGTFQWVKTWGGQGADDVAEAVIVDGADNVYVTGRFGCKNCDMNPDGPSDIESSVDDLDAFLIKYNAGGTFQWAKTWGDAGSDAGGALALDTSNNIYVTGVISSTNGVDMDPDKVRTDYHKSHGLHDVFVSRFAPDGVLQWAKTWGGSGKDIGYDVAVDAAGDVFAAGSFESVVDMDPDSGVRNFTSNGGTDASISKFVPDIPAGTSTATSTPTATGILTATPTATGTLTSSRTSTPLMTATLTATPTATLTAILTLTPSPSDSPSTDVNILKRVKKIDASTHRYTLKVTNQGTIAASTVVIHDKFPANYTITGIKGGGMTCSRVRRTVSCQIAALNQGVTITVKILAVTNGAKGQNCAVVTFAGSDPDTLDNRSCVAVPR